MSSCQKITPEEYKNQSVDYTKKALEELNKQLQETNPIKPKTRKRTNSMSKNESDGGYSSSQNQFFNIPEENLSESDSDSNSDSDILSNSDDDKPNVSNNITIISGKHKKNKKPKYTDSSKKIVSEVISSLSNINTTNNKYSDQILKLKNTNSSLKKENSSIEKKYHFLKLEFSNIQVDNEKLKDKNKLLETENKQFKLDIKQIKDQKYWILNREIFYKYCLYISMFINIYYYLFY